MGLSVMIEDAWRQATLPLFEAGRVEALEWSFDRCWGGAPPPDWCEALLDFYAEAGRLDGHGVRYSPLTLGREDHHRAWLERLDVEVARRPYRRISEHYGFMLTADHDFGAPLPPLPCRQMAEAGQAQLTALAHHAAGARVGLENLALAFGPPDVQAQGPMLEALLAPIDGFIVLDLHNLYCQLVNFDLDLDALLGSYPLARVTALHISGGSWSHPRRDPARRAFRRDTHDGDVPEAVFALIAPALSRCPHVETVTLERLGVTLTLDDDDGHAQLRRDFERVHQAVDAWWQTAGASPTPPAATPPDWRAALPRWSATDTGRPLTASDLAMIQRRALALLEAGADQASLRSALGGLSAQLDAHLDDLEDRCLEVATALTHRWSRRRT